MTHDIDTDPIYCAECGKPCEVDDGSVEPELMRGALRMPFAPASMCCGAELLDEPLDEEEDE